MVHLDTNFLISAIRVGSPEAAIVDAWLTAGEPVGISAVAWAEVYAGPLSARGERIARNLFQDVESLSRADAEMARRFFNQTAPRTRSLSDSMIAASAIPCPAK